MANTSSNNKPRISITRTGQTVTELMNFIRLDYKMTLQATRDLAIQTKYRMKHAIKQSVHRHPNTGRLRQSITVERLFNQFGGGFSYCIGDTDKMPPYWAAANYGGFVPPSSVGHFGRGDAPQGGYNKQKWHPASEGGGGFMMIPQEPARALNYIRKTLTWVNTKWASHWYNDIRKRARRFKGRAQYTVSVGGTNVGLGI